MHNFGYNLGYNFGLNLGHDSKSPRAKKKRDEAIFEAKDVTKVLSHKPHIIELLKSRGRAALSAGQLGSSAKLR